VDNSKNKRLTFTFPNSGIVQTFTRDPGVIVEPSPNPDKQPHTFYSSRIIHTLDSGFELITSALSEPPLWINNLKDNLEMPGDALLRHLTINGAAFGVRWQSYDLQFVGIVIDQSARAECSWPFWRTSDKNGNDIELVQVWYQRVACVSSSVFCDIKWQPDRGETIGFPGLESVKRGRDITLAWRGRVLLQKINPRGRPESSVTLTREQFIERAPQACWMLYETFGEIPTDVQIAEELHISRATLYRYMERYNLSLNQIRDMAIKVLIEPASF
jgi:hypothetical protein